MWERNGFNYSEGVGNFEFYESTRLEAEGVQLRNGI